MNAAQMDENTIRWQTIMRVTPAASAIATATIGRILPTPAKNTKH
jgi:hypothetical protein